VGHHLGKGKEAAVSAVDIAHVNNILAELEKKQVQPEGRVPIQGLLLANGFTCGMCAQAEDPICSTSSKALSPHKRLHAGHQVRLEDCFVQSTGPKKRNFLVCPSSFLPTAHAF